MIYRVFNFISRVCIFNFVTFYYLRACTDEDELTCPTSDGLLDQEAQYDAHFRNYQRASYQNPGYDVDVAVPAIAVVTPGKT